MTTESLSPLGTSAAAPERHEPRPGNERWSNEVLIQKAIGYLDTYEELFGGGDEDVEELAPMPAFKLAACDLAFESICGHGSSEDAATAVATACRRIADVSMPSLSEILDDMHRAAAVMSSQPTDLTPDEKKQYAAARTIFDTAVPGIMMARFITLCNEAGIDHFKVSSQELIQYMKKNKKVIELYTYEPFIEEGAPSPCPHEGGVDLNVLAAAIRRVDGQCRLGGGMYMVGPTNDMIKEVKEPVGWDLRPDNENHTLKLALFTQGADANQGEVVVDALQPQTQPVFGGLDELLAWRRQLKGRGMDLNSYEFVTLNLLNVYVLNMCERVADYAKSIPLNSNPTRVVNVFHSHGVFDAIDHNTWMNWINDDEQLSEYWSALTPQERRVLIEQMQHPAAEVLNPQTANKLAHHIAQPDAKVLVERGGKFVGGVAGAQAGERKMQIRVTNGIPHFTITYGPDGCSTAVDVGLGFQLVVGGSPPASVSGQTDLVHVGTGDAIEYALRRLHAQNRDNLRERMWEVIANSKLETSRPRLSRDKRRGELAVALREVIEAACTDPMVYGGVNGFELPRDSILRAVFYEMEDAGLSEEDVADIGRRLIQGPADAQTRLH